MRDVQRGRYQLPSSHSGWMDSLPLMVGINSLLRLTQYRTAHFKNRMGSVFDLPMQRTVSIYIYTFVYMYISKTIASVCFEVYNVIESKYIHVLILKQVFNLTC